MSDKVKSDLKKGEGKYGTAVPYAPYVNYGTRFMSAQPFLSSSIEIVRRKATGTYKKEMGKAINKGLRKKFRQQISKNVEFVGADLDLPIDDGAEESLLTLLAVGITEAKAMCPVADVNGGRLRASIMWKTTKQEGGFGES